MISTGLRRGELLKLRWADVGLAAGTLTVRRENAKTDRARTVPLNREARDVLAGLHYEGALTVFAGRGYGDSTVSANFVEACEEAGLPGVHLHTLRHTFATRLKDRGADPFTIRDLPGHATLVMTSRYTHASPGVMREAVESLGAARVLAFGDKSVTGSP